MQKGNDFKPIGILTGEIFKKHRTPSNHPESSTRMDVLLKALKDVVLKIDYIEPRVASEKELKLVHTEDYINYIVKQTYKAEKTSRVKIDPDTWISKDSLEVAKTAVGGCFNLADNLLTGNISSAFAITRPPGHHAQTYRSMGFCMFNNLALTARYILNNSNKKKIAIVDFDVHHGNGAQQIFYHYDNVLAISLHQKNLWPHKGGFAQEIGAGKAEGYNINLAFEKGNGNFEYEKALYEIIIPVLDQYEPDVILIAAGYDSHEDDLMGDINLSSEYYYHFTKRLESLDKAVPIMCFLEGGYYRPALCESVLFTLRALDKEMAIDDSIAFIDASDNDMEITCVEEVKKILSSYWKF